MKAATLPATHRLHTPLFGSGHCLPLAFCVALVIGGCADETASHTQPHTTEASATAFGDSFLDVFEIVERIELEETDRVVNVMPMASIEASGEILVADVREAQLRRYSSAGELLGVFGRRGGGPGEFQFPVTLGRLDSDLLYVIDVTESRLTILDDALTEAVGSVNIGLFPLYGGTLLGDGKMLLTGRDVGERRSNMLHEFDLETGRVERSYFEMPISGNHEVVAQSLGYATVALREDTIASAFALTDTVFLFYPSATTGTDVGPAETIGIPLTGLNVAEPPAQARTDPRARSEWLRTMRTIADLHWLDDGSFVVQTARTGGRETEWGLIGFSRNGDLLYELLEAPRLLDVVGDRFFFLDPEADIPNAWISAKRAET